MLLRRAFSTFALSFVLSACALAAGAPVTSAAASAQVNIPSVLNVPMRGGLSIIKRFKGPSGLTGWLMKEPSGDYIPLFTTPDGKVLIAGALVNAKGVNLSRMYRDLYAPKLNLTALWKRFEKSSYVIEGPAHSKHVIYVVMDPNCIFCHLFWLALQPYVKAGLQVRWVPVGFLQPTSLNKAAQILTQGDRALTKDEKNFNVKIESGGIKGIAPNTKVSAELASNYALMKAALVRGTPGVFYKNSSGAVVRHVGMPPIASMPAITGLPAQAETSKELNKFLKRL